MDTNSGTPPTNEKDDELSGDRLSSVEETIDWVVNFYSVGTELPKDAEAEVSASESLPPSDAPVIKSTKDDGGCSEDGNNTKPMTDEEKLQLSRGISKVYGPNLTKVIGIIQSLEQRESDSKGFTINVEKLQPATSRALESFLVSCIGERDYYKKIAITREQRVGVRLKRKLRKVEKELQEGRDSTSSDSYASSSGRSTPLDDVEIFDEVHFYEAPYYKPLDQVTLATDIVQPEKIDTRRELDRHEVGPPSVSDPLAHDSEKEECVSQPLPHPHDNKSK